MRPRWILCLLLACLWFPAANAADGIKPGEHFRVPFYVDGVSVVNRATLLAGTDGQAMLRVLYVKGDTIAEAVYKVERIDVPDPKPDPKPDPTPDPNPWTPVDQWRPVVKPLLAFALDRQDSIRIAEMYGVAASQIAAGAIATTLDLRQWIIVNGKELGLQGKYPGLADSMNNVMAEAMGLDVRPLNAERSTEFLHTLAWAIWEAGR